MTQRTPKRSRGVALTSLLAASTALASCGGSADTADWSDGDTAEATPFQSVAQCAASGEFTQAECQTAYSQAVAGDQKQAPRFDSRELCEEQYGEGQCESRGSGGFFSPLLTGFLIGNVLSGGGYNRHYAPYYRDRRSGGYFAGGTWMRPSYGGRYELPSRSLTRPVTTPRVQTRSSVVSRGGFGGRTASASSSSSARGWGG